MKNLKVALTLITLLSFSFYAFKPITSTNETIHGVWIYDSYKDGMNVLKKAKAFKKNKAGIELKEDGTLIKRQNAGWCGTPPITYTNSKGVWQWETASVIRLEYDYWRGKDTMRLEVAAVDGETLKWKRLGR